MKLSQLVVAIFIFFVIVCLLSEFTFAQEAQQQTQPPAIFPPLRFEVQEFLESTFDRSSTTLRFAIKTQEINGGTPSALLWFLLGRTLQEQEKDLQGAIRAYQRAWQIGMKDPKAYSAHAIAGCKLGKAFVEIDQWEEAMKAFRNTVSTHGFVPDALYRLVYLLHFSCDFDRREDLMETIYRWLNQELTLDPTFTEMTPSQTLMFLPDDLIRRVAHTFVYQAAYRTRGNHNPQSRRLHPLFLALSSPPSSSSSLSPLPTSFPNVRLRIAYVSRDLCYSSVGQLVTRLFPAHDRRQFEVFAYSLGREDPTEWRQRLMKGVDQWRDAVEHVVTGVEVAKMINDDKIDILIDLIGPLSAMASEMLSCRPAMVQINFLGWLASGGSSAVVDAFAIDPIAAPPEYQSHFAEKLIYLPESYQVNSNRYNHPTIAPVAESRSSLGLVAGEENKIILANFNQLFKIQPDCFNAWLKIMKNVPEAVLCLLKFSSSPNAPPKLAKAAEEAGVDPSRIRFSDFHNDKQYFMIRAAAADMFLDNTHYNGGTTGSDALYAQLPVLTVPGDRVLSRMGASLANALRFPHLITRTLDDYIAVATRLASTPGLLRRLRNGLGRQVRSAPLFDCDKWVLQWEQALLMFYESVGLKLVEGGVEEGENRKPWGHVVVARD